MEEIKRISRMETWLTLKQIIIEKDYRLWQTKYGCDAPEGYHARFMQGDKRLEVITHNKDIVEDIFKSRL